jgi:hypothetical protein
MEKIEFKMSFKSSKSAAGLNLRIFPKYFSDKNLELAKAENEKFAKDLKEIILTEGFFDTLKETVVKIKNTAEEMFDDFKLKAINVLFKSKIIVKKFLNLLGLNLVIKKTQWPAWIVRKL